MSYMQYPPVNVMPQRWGGGWVFVQKTCLYRPPPSRDCDMALLTWEILMLIFVTKVDEDPME